MRTPWKLSAVAVGALTACLGNGDNGPTGRLAIDVLPLSLEGIDDSCYDLIVTNGPGGGGDVVWSQDDVCASRYGDGRGAIAYVGTCDADVPGPHSVILELTGLYSGGEPVAFTNPCGAPDNAPCVVEAPCAPNADTPVVFDLTIARPARQGFFDVAVEFDDTFCSAKLDCVDEDLVSPLALLHDPSSGNRAPSVVMGLACTGGLAADTQLHLDGPALVCGEEVIPLAIGGPPGNVYAADTPAPAPLLQVATYRGVEALTDPGGTSWSKVYFNVAFALDFAALDSSCTFVADVSASDGPLPTPWTTPAVAAWPVLRYGVPIATAGATGYSCARQALGDGPEDGVWIDYVDDEDPITFDWHAYVDGGVVVVEPHPGPLTLSPSEVVLAVGNHHTFTAGGGPRPTASASPGSARSLATPTPRPPSAPPSSPSPTRSGPPPRPTSRSTRRSRSRPSRRP